MLNLDAGAGIREIFHITPSVAVPRKRTKSKRVQREAKQEGTSSCVSEL